MIFNEIYTIFIDLFIIYITWNIFRKGEKFIQINYGRSRNHSSIFLTFLCFGIALLCISPLIINKRFISNNQAKEYSSLLLYLFIGLFPWLEFQKRIKNQNSMGKLIFKSNSRTKTIYLTIPGVILILWNINKDFLLLINDFNFFSIKYFFKINNLHHLSEIWFLISAIIYLFVISWYQLEIREKGIWYMDRISWQDINSYSWSDNKNNQLILNYNNYFNENHNKLNIIVHPEEKEQIDNILHDKLNN